MIRNRKIQHYFDLVAVLTQKEIKVRYKNSVLGYLWSVAQPLSFAFIFFLVFKVVMRVQMENYTLFLVSGLFPWQWFSNSVAMSPGIFISNASIIKKVNFPRNVILLAMVVQDMFHFVMTIPVIVVFLFIYHKQPSLSWCYGIPILLVLQLMLTYGISLALATFNLFFRDLERLVSIFMMLAFYATPVLYPQSMVPEKHRHWLYWNPLAPLVTSWRNLFQDGTVSPLALLVSLGWGVASFALGYAVYRKLSGKFAEVL